MATIFKSTASGGLGPQVIDPEGGGTPLSYISYITKWQGRPPRKSITRACGSLAYLRAIWQHSKSHGMLKHMPSGLPLLVEMAPPTFMFYTIFECKENWA